MPALPTVETLGEARRRWISSLRDVSDSPEIDVDLLIGHALRLSRLQILSSRSEPVSDFHSALIEPLIHRRRSGEPIAYITGYKDFRHIRVNVDCRVLVPRPETEQMVEMALNWINLRDSALSVVDVGTGSGAIALALADETGEFADRLSIVATDISADALAVAASNRRQLRPGDRVRLVHGSLLDELPGPFDLVLANLPYLRPDQRHRSTEAEPDIALYSGADGFDLYRQLIHQLPGRLADSGLFVAEIDPSQADVGRQELIQSTELPVTVRKDLTGRDRFLLAGAWKDIERGYQQ